MAPCLIMCLLSITGLGSILFPRSWWLRILKLAVVANLAAMALGLKGTVGKALEEHRDPMVGAMTVIMLFGVLLLLQTVGYQRVQRFAREAEEQRKLDGKPA